MLVSVGSPTVNRSEHVNKVKKIHKLLSHTWDDGPVVENLQTKRLALCGSPQIRLETIRINYRDESLHSVKR